MAALTLLCDVLEALLNASAALYQEEGCILEQSHDHLTVQGRFPIINVQIQDTTQKLCERCEGVGVGCNV